jgi:coatomer subunit beta
MAAENNCTLLVSLPDKVALPSVAEITAELESSDAVRKCAALKKTIQLVLSGEEMPRVMMTVIRYCITVEDHMLQKLLMLYYEVVRKYDSAGKLLPEMILVWCVWLCGRRAPPCPPPPPLLRWLPHAFPVRPFPYP